MENSITILTANLPFILLLAATFFTARTLSQGYSRAHMWRTGLFWCGAIALFAATTLGDPSCIAPFNLGEGNCIQFADDGYEPTIYNRLLNFSLFFGALYGAFALGVVSRRK